MARRPVKAIGVDIGSSSIKLAEASFEGGKYTIDRALVFNIEPDTWADGIPEDIDSVSIHLRQALKAFGSSTKNVTMSVPTSALMVRNVPMDKSLRGDELWRTVEANLSQYIPFSSEEVMMDFQIIGPTAGLDNHNDVLITAVEKEFVLQRQVLTDMCSIKAVAMDGDIYALLNLVSEMEDLSLYGDYDAIAIIEIGLHRSGLHVVLGDGSTYVREFPLGGERFTENIADGLDISLSEAEERKCAGTWDNDQITSIKQQIINEVSDQVLSALEVYLPNNPQIKLKKLFLAGGSANISGLAEGVSKATSYEVKVLDPSNIVTFAPNAMTQNELSASLGIACGLAMRSVG